MQQLFVLKDLVYGKKVGSTVITGLDEIDSLQSGALGIFVDEVRTLITTGNVAALSGDKEHFYFAMGEGDTVKPTRLSMLVNRRTTKVSYHAYAAGVSQRSFLGYDGVDATTAMNYIAIVKKYDEYGVQIWDTNISDTDVLGRYNYTVNAVSTAETQDALITRLVALINADPNRIVDATKIGAGTGIQLDRRATGAPSVAVGKPFKFIGLGGLIDATKMYTNAQSLVAKGGQGDYQSVLDLENRISAYQGNRGIETYKADFWSKASRVESGVNYDMVLIQFDKIVGREVSDIDFQNSRRMIWLAYPTSPSLFVLSTIKTIMGELASSTAADIEIGGS